MLTAYHAQQCAVSDSVPQRASDRTRKSRQPPLKNAVPQSIIRRDNPAEQGAAKQRGHLSCCRQVCDQRTNLHANMIIESIPSATAISIHGTPETRGRAGSCNIARAIRDGVEAVPAASSSAPKGAAAGSSAATLSAVLLRSMSTPLAYPRQRRSQRNSA